MALSAAELLRLERLAGEAHKAESDRLLDDARLQNIADESAKVVDSAGLAPSASGYVDTYDLYAAAAECWREKAGIVVEQFDFETEGGMFKRSQQYKMFLAQATRYAGLAMNLDMEIERAVTKPDNE